MLNLLICTFLIKQKDKINNKFREIGEKRKKYFILFLLTWKI